jgi:hypothetical protein
MFHADSPLIHHPSPTAPPQHDLVPRTCVANLAQLQRELEGHRDDFFGRNKVWGLAGALVWARAGPGPCQYHLRVTWVSRTQSHI